MQNSDTNNSQSTDRETNTKELSDKLAADLVEEVIHGAEAALQEGELANLEAVADHLRDEDDTSNIATVAPDGGVVTTAAPDGGDLTRFQQALLRTLAKEGEMHGLAIKEELENERDEAVNHGRLYPNLDKLVTAGLVDKRELDRRTNGYDLTDGGREMVRRFAQQWMNATDALNGGGN